MTRRTRGHRRLASATLFAVTVCGVALVAAPAAGAAVPTYGPVVGVAAMPTGAGAWTVTAGGAVSSYGAALDNLLPAATPRDFGPGAVLGTSTFNPVVGIAADPDGAGYWLVSSDGRVLGVGAATYYGSRAYRPLAPPVVGIASTPDGRGYWLVAADGGVFSFGDAHFHGSIPGRHDRVDDVNSMAVSETGRGYWLGTSAGSLWAFGSVTPHTAGTHSSYGSSIGIVAGAAQLGFWSASPTGTDWYGETMGLSRSSGASTDPYVAVSTTATGKSAFLASAFGTVTKCAPGGGCTSLPASVTSGS